MTAVLLTVGDELLIGQVVNTNASRLGEQLGLAGVAVTRMETVGDDVAAIRRALGRALDEAPLVVVTGGLGPTHDDVTVQAVAEALGRPVVFDPALMAEVEAKFAARGRPVRPAHRAFAERPGRVLSRAQLLDIAHPGGSDPFDRSIDVRITRLRRKIERNAAAPALIRTVRGAGYVYDG